jgi:hypothetical protein
VANPRPEAQEAMKKFLLPSTLVMPVLILALAFWLGNRSVHAQAPAGLNPGNYISNTATAADTSSSTLTLGDASHFTYVCGFAVSGLGATAATSSSVTIGPLTSTTGSNVSPAFGYVFVAGATLPNTPLLQNFVPCVPVSGVATLTVPGAAGNTTTSLSIWGYKQ